MMNSVNKQLVYNVIHFKWQPAILCSNDAKYFHNCIVHSVESMKMQRLVMPANPMKCMLVTLKEL